MRANLKKILAVLAKLYPNQKEVYRTYDDLIHLTVEEAEAQAMHLSNKSIKTHSLPKSK